MERKLGKSTGCLWQLCRPWASSMMKSAAVSAEQLTGHHHCSRHVAAPGNPLLHSLLPSCLRVSRLCWSGWGGTKADLRAAPQKTEEVGLTSFSSFSGEGESFQLGGFHLELSRASTGRGTVPAERGRSPFSPAQSFSGPWFHCVAEVS